MGKDYTLHGPQAIKKVGLAPFIEVNIGGKNVMTPDLLAHEVELHGHTVTEKARDVMHQEAFTVHLDETVVSLYLISPRSLGLGEVSVGDFYAEMEALKVQKCLPDIGPLGRIHFKHQPPWSNVHLYMEPILNSSGEPMVFTWSKYFLKEIGDYKHVDSRLDAVSMMQNRIIPDTYHWIVELPEDWSLSQ